jgi:hypothetical protein
MRVDEYEFGRIVIDGKQYESDLVVSGGTIKRRRKRGSKKLKLQYGHTPLSEHEELPWDCDKLVVGTGFYGGLPITDGVRDEARRRGVALLEMPTTQALQHLNDAKTCLVLHLTC